MSEWSYISHPNIIFRTLEPWIPYNKVNIKEDTKFLRFNVNNYNLPLSTTMKEYHLLFTFKNDGEYANFKLEYKLSVHFGGRDILDRDNNLKTLTICVSIYTRELRKRKFTYSSNIRSSLKEQEKLEQEEDKILINSCNELRRCFDYESVYEMTKIFENWPKIYGFDLVITEDPEMSYSIGGTKFKEIQQNISSLLGQE